MARSEDAKSTSVAATHRACFLPLDRKSRVRGSALRRRYASLRVSTPSRYPVSPLPRCCSLEEGPSAFLARGTFLQGRTPSIRANLFSVSFNLLFLRPFRLALLPFLFIFLLKEVGVQYITYVLYRSVGILFSSTLLGTDCCSFSFGTGRERI